MINNISMHFCMSFLPFSSGIFHYVVPVPLWFFVMILASFVPVPRFSVRHPLNPKTRNQYSAPAERLLFFPCGRLALCKSNYLFPARNEEHVYVWFVSFLSAVLPQSCNDFHDLLFSGILNFILHNWNIRMLSSRCDLLVLCKQECLLNYPA